MEKDKLIHKFLDGELTSEQETELFYNISSDDDMRMELKEQLAIKNAIRGDIKASTPKAASTMAIFSELDFTPPPVADVPASGGAVVPPVNSVWSVLSKYSGFIWTGLATAVTTIFVMLFLMEPDNFNGTNIENNTVAENSNSIVNSQNQMASDRSVPVIESTNSDVNNNDAIAQSIQAEQKVVYKYIYITKEKPKTEEIKEIETIVKDIHKADIADNDLASLHSEVIPVYDAGLAMPALIDNNQSLDGPTAIMRDENSNAYGIIFEFRTAKDWTNSAGLNPSHYQDWNNTSIGLFKELDTEFALGLEYRRENFYLDFQGTEGTNQLYKYEVYPNISSLSAAVRYSPEFLRWYNFSPFAQLALGANNVGPVGRFLVGTQYSPSGSYSLIFGINGSAMRYNFQGTDYTSNKFGIQFGASFRF